VCVSVCVRVSVFERERERESHTFDFCTTKNLILTMGYTLPGTNLTRYSRLVERTVTLRFIHPWLHARVIYSQQTCCLRITSQTMRWIEPNVSDKTHWLECR